jgi:hypothetical protein
MRAYDLRVVASDYVGLFRDVKVYTCDLASNKLLYDQVKAAFSVDNLQF